MGRRLLSRSNVVLIGLLLLIALALCSCSRSSSLTTSPPAPPISSSTTTVAVSSGEPTTSPPAASSTEFEVGMGANENDIRLSSIWRQAAADGAFEPETASADWLMFAFSPRGWLIDLLMVASTDDKRQVTLDWSGAVIDTPQNVMVNVTVEGGSPSTDEAASDRVSKILFALDMVGTKTMIAKLPQVGPTGYYLVSPLLGVTSEKGAMPEQAEAYIWEGSEFALLPLDDPRRAYDAKSVYFKAYADVEGLSLQTETTSSQPPLIFFVVPQAMLSTTTTTLPHISLLNWLRLDVTPRPGVRVAIGGLKQEPGELTVTGEIIIDNQSDSPFLYQAGDFSLYVREAKLTAAVSPPMLPAGEVQPREILHGYLLTWTVPSPSADHIGLSYLSSDPASDGFNQTVSIMP